MEHEFAWGRGPEGQRIADLGDGTYRNPVIPGDHADPTILRHGTDYWMTFSSFQNVPGLVIWHSTDLVNWRPVTAALNRPVGTVWAPDLAWHDGRFLIYFPVLTDQGNRIMVVHAKGMEGPWSDPIDLGLEGCIDPGHAVGEDGSRWLFFNGIRRIRLSDDGLRVTGPLEDVCQPWRYPEDWEVEMFAPEGPKLLRRGGWFYMVSAVGGTSGPPTSHMVVVSRSRSIHGPWEDCPANPVLRTWSAKEAWWSRGHATPVEGPSGDWWLVYHGYENGFRTLGRQTILEPARWTEDGWLEALGGDLSTALGAPQGGVKGPAGMILSDDFSGPVLGLQWSFFLPEAREGLRVGWERLGLRLEAKGMEPGDSSPLTFLVGDRAFEVEVEVEPRDGAVGALLLFYNARAYVGLGVAEGELRTWNYAQEHPWMRLALPPGPTGLRFRSVNQVLTWWWRSGSGPWQRHPWQMEVSGLHHNVFGDFTALKVGLASMGQGAVVFRDLRYRGL